MPCRDLGSRARPRRASCSCGLVVLYSLSCPVDCCVRVCLAPEGSWCSMEFFSGGVEGFWLKEPGRGHGNHLPWPPELPALPWLGLWRYWIFFNRGEAATNIAVCRLIARPPKKKKTWSHLCKCMVCCSKVSASYSVRAAEPRHIVAGVRFHWSREEMHIQREASWVEPTLTASAQARRCTRTERNGGFGFQTKVKDCFLNQRRWHK